jgi:hypothetical protein
MIQPIHEVFYIEALAFNVDAILRCVEKLNLELEEHTSEPIQRKANTILNVLQEMVVHAANISKFFFPVRKDLIHKSRGAKLREVFEVTEDNPICNRDARNTIEHFDERMDKFLSEFPTGTVYPEYVGSKEKVLSPTNKFFRAYSLDTEEFQILQTPIKIRPLVEAVTRIRLKIDAQIQKGMRF